MWQIEQLCQRYTGFLRVGFAEPLGERRWFRRGWVSFQRDVNIKDIAWNMGSVRVPTPPMFRPSYLAAKRGG